MAINKIYYGRKILWLSKPKSRNGGTILLSMITKTSNEIPDAMNAVAICVRFSERKSVCMSVSAMGNELIVAELSTPLMSMETDEDDTFYMLGS